MLRRFLMFAFTFAYLGASMYLLGKLDAFLGTNLLTDDEVTLLVISTVVPSFLATVFFLGDPHVVDRRFDD